MPPRQAAGGGGPPTEDDINQLLLQMAQSSQQLTAAVASLATSQAPFMRPAADADVNIGLSKSHSLLDVEQIAAQRIDNTVDDHNQSGLPTALRDTRPSAPADYISDPMTLTTTLPTFVMVLTMAPGTTTLRLSELMNSPHITETEVEKSGCSKNSCLQTAL